LAGIGYGLLAYGIWGFFPLYFRQLSHVAPMDVLSHRAAWACLFVGLLLTLRGRWANVAAILRKPRQLGMLALAALLVGSNWLVFLWAVANQQVVASSLGYFLTPLVNVLLGLLVLKEKLNRLEWLSVALAVAAIGNEVATLGSLPWVSLFLAATFGTYGLVRKQVPVDALSGLWLETLCMLPVCALYAIWMAQGGHAVFAVDSVSTLGWLIGAGIMTALPLMAFAAATQRLASPRHRRHADVHQSDHAVPDRHLHLRRAVPACPPDQFRPDLARAGGIQYQHVGKAAAQVMRSGA
jgi:chloramphenicol-sensitive protein RarD